MALQLGGARAEGAASTPCSSSASMRRRRSARCTCRRSASPAAASRPRSSCGASSLAAIVLLRRDRFYRRFGLGRGMTIAAPSAASLRGAASPRRADGAGDRCVEVTGFTFMAFFISRIGATAVAGHQIAVNLVSMMFMMPLAIANATSTLVAQRVGAGDCADARRIGWHGLEIGVGVAAVVGGAVYFAARAGGRPLHRQPGDRRRGAAAAGLGRAVPRRRRGADDRRVRAARLSHRDRAAARSTSSRCGASASAAATSRRSIRPASARRGCTARAASGRWRRSASPSPRIGLTGTPRLEAATRGGASGSDGAGPSLSRERLRQQSDAVRD